MPGGKHLDVVDIQSSLPSSQLAVLRGDHISVGSTSTKRPYEEFLLRVAVALTGRGDRVLDVGANIGNHTISRAEAGLNVISFEPNPAFRFVLERNVEMNDLRGQVDVRPFALGRAPLRGMLNPLIEGNQGAVAVEEDEGADIEMAPLDSLGIGRVSLVKIDVKGREADVPSGGRHAYAVETVCDSGGPGCIGRSREDLAGPRLPATTSLARVHGHVRVRPDEAIAAASRRRQIPVAWADISWNVLDGAQHLPGAASLRSAHARWLAGSNLAPARDTSMRSMEASPGSVTTMRALDGGRPTPGNGAKEGALARCETEFGCGSVWG